ncbi:GNAT family N-acetyltransferase [Actinopolymorpha sp. B17G11]|uniref:GNAT family N-acetyltransferase n=1 Tax=unclassified Actinopolymorpha TaxID=2627063 RepID=UPI0032D93D4D
MSGIALRCARVRTPNTETVVRHLRSGDFRACDDIVQSLPYFFGSDVGVVACARAVRTQRGWVAEECGQVNVFLVVDYPLPSAPEITWMAVRAGFRRRGLGRALIDRAVRELRAAGALVLSVLTLAASVPETGSDTYAS